MIRRLALAGTAVLLAATLAGCAPDGSGTADATSEPVRTFTPSASPQDGATPTPTPSAAESAELPDDCREILSPAVLAELSDVPLNDEAFGPGGAQSDGSLICNWGDPGADTTRLTTVVSRAYRGEALDMLNGLVEDEGFACYAPDGGTRCEKTWENEQYPVTDGRTLFWRDDVLIDTTYSNLAPDGYTAAIVENLFD